MTQSSEPRRNGVSSDDGPVKELVCPSYPLEQIDRARLNQIIRHRVRNLCGGCRMILDVLRAHVPEATEDPIEWDALYNEVDEVQQFSNRLDLLIDPLPPLQSLPLHEVFVQAQETFARRYPLCSLEMNGPHETGEFRGANWLGIILDELLSNAGHAAGRDGSGIVEVAWTLDPELQIVVANSGARFAAEIPVDPPVPFRSTAPSYDGLGLSIVYRLCLALNTTMAVRTDLPDMTAVVIGQRAHGEEPNEAAVDTPG